MGAQAEGGKKARRGVLFCLPELLNPKCIQLARHSCCQKWNASCFCTPTDFYSQGLTQRIWKDLILFFWYKMIVDNLQYPVYSHALSGALAQTSLVPTGASL